MPLYEFRCRSCGWQGDLVFAVDDDSRHHARCGCGERLSRRFGFRLVAGFAEHRNPSTGRWTTSDRQFRDDLKRASEEATLATGIEHNYQPADLRDPAVAPRSDDGLASQHDRAVAEGRKPAVGRTVF